MNSPKLIVPKTSTLDNLACGSPDITRRKFLTTASTLAAGMTILKPGLVGAAEANSKINLGLIGCGGRGAWIADLFA
jgi:hypothetical protein